MNTHRETIMQAVMAALTGNTPAAGNVYRSRVEALARDELPAIVVKPGAEAVQHIATGLTQRDFEIHLEVHTRGTPADALADPIFAALHAALMADQTLGGKARRLIEKETAEPQFADGDDTAAQIIVTYSAAYITKANDITRPV